MDKIRAERCTKTADATMPSTGEAMAQVGKRRNVMRHQEEPNLFDTGRRDSLPPGASRFGNPALAHGHGVVPPGAAAGGHPGASEGHPGGCGGPHGARVLAAVEGFLRGRTTRGKQARPVPESVPLFPRGGGKGGSLGNTGTRSSPTGTPPGPGPGGPGAGPGRPRSESTQDSHAADAEGPLWRVAVESRAEAVKWGTCDYDVCLALGLRNKR